MRWRPLYAAAEPTATIGVSRRASGTPEDEPAVQRGEAPEHDQGQRPVPRSGCLLDEQGSGPDDRPGRRLQDERYRRREPPPQAEQGEQPEEAPTDDEGDAGAGV